MSSTREMRLRIRSVKSIAQVTKALETVSASKIRRATQAVSATQPYSEKAWKVLLHLARQPGHSSLHPLLKERPEIKNILVVMVSSDSGLAGAYNINVLKNTLQNYKNFKQPVSFVAVGRKGRDLLARRNMKIFAEFSHLPSPLIYSGVSAIGRLVVDEYLKGTFDQVYLSYTDFQNMVRQETIFRKLLPLEVDILPEGQESFNASHHKTTSVFTFEPDQEEVLSQVIPRFTALQIYAAILSSHASEHASRMIAMRNATDNAKDLIDLLQLEYNKIRQQGITGDLLDIAGGAEALAKGKS